MYSYVVRGYNNQGTNDVFRDENTTSMTPMMYLQLKIQQATY